ncbi:MAG: DUF2207 domain-containing protein [Gemmatimonadaceae bacterium]
MRPALAFATLCFCTLAREAGAQGRSIRIRDFGALLTVHSDGSLDVTEQLTVRFDGQWNGIVRDLSLRHNTARGRATKLDVRIGYITDSLGNRLRVEQESKDGGWTRSLRIYVPGANDADRQVIIRYRVANAIRFYYDEKGAGDFDELYWNVTGNDWTMPVDSVHGRVVLPDDVAATRTAVYTGVRGSVSSDAKIERDSNEIVFTTLRGLAPYEGMTIGVGWPAGHIASRPPQSRERLLDVVQWTPLLIPLVVFLLAFRRWQRSGKDPEEGSLVVRYEPVADTSPAELGTLVDNKADMEDITATLVDLAVRGYVHITELTEKHLFGLAKSTDYQLDIIRKRSDWKDLKPHEVSYLDALGHAAPSDAYSVKVSELKNRFYKFLPEIKNAIYDGLVDLAYYRERPDRAKAKSIGLAVLVGLVLGGLMVLSAAQAWTFVARPAMIVAAVISTIILLIFAQIMPARTVAGARAREAALGFKEFLSRVEEDRYKRMITSPELFETYLPYAMAFGVEEKWANAFKDIYREPPQWYTGGAGPFNVGSFSHSIGEMSSAAASSMSSSPSSSGSGGGGSSGGGSGGGGGSGF